MNPEISTSFTQPPPTLELKKFCVFCGKPTPSVYRFCRFCGKRQGLTEHFRFSDPAVRLVRVSDITDLAKLFRLNYGDDYPYPEVYDGSLINRCIYTDNIICVVVEEKGEAVASGALILDYGNYDDQVGEIGRLVVNPEYAGQGLGTGIINALLEAAADNVEFVVGETRTEHSFSQSRVERAGLVSFGFVPQYHSLNERRESAVLYGKLLGNGESLRSKDTPHVIPEVAPLAHRVLSSMGLRANLSIVDECLPYPAAAAHAMRALDRLWLGELTRMKYGRLIEPLIFGPVSLEHGYSFIRRRNAEYLVAVDKDQRPVGSVGYQYTVNKILRGIELVAEREELIGGLCRTLVEKANELGAELVEVNVSAYDARLQRTFFNHGFRPAAYAPAMVFHNTERLDVVKMVKLNIPYEPGNMKLTEKAKEMVSIVKAGFK